MTVVLFLGWLRAGLLGLGLLGIAPCDQPCAIGQHLVLDAACAQPLVDLLAGDAKESRHLAGREFVHSCLKNSPPPPSVTRALPGAACLGRRGGSGESGLVASRTRAGLTVDPPKAVCGALNLLARITAVPVVEFVGHLLDQLSGTAGKEIVAAQGFGLARHLKSPGPCGANSARSSRRSLLAAQSSASALIIPIRLSVSTEFSRSGKDFQNSWKPREKQMVLAGNELWVDGVK